eukprot:scaffold96741_cov64-Phaeocystis_antarctica.AAC.6
MARVRVSVRVRDSLTILRVEHLVCHGALTGARHACPRRGSNVVRESPLWDTCEHTPPEVERDRILLQETAWLGLGLGLGLGLA